MRLGVIWESGPNANYRAVAPLEAMERAGHDVVWPTGSHGKGNLRQLTGCDAVHVYRRFDRETQTILQRLIAGGTGITWDNDDDLSAVPRESPLYAKTGGLAGRKIFAATVKTALTARVVTTPSAIIANRYRENGIRRVEVIDNTALSVPARRPRARNRIVIGWVAGLEHRADLVRIPIVAALERLQAEHEELDVDCIGVDLGLAVRYRHDELVEFKQLTERMAAFDIGIAPLADIPFNRSRSNIKVKEYAACGVPWLASPVGPYVGLGEGQGGRLVSDDGWYDALKGLVTHARTRKRLARKGAKWAKRQRIATAAAQWESVFAEAADRT